MTSMTLGLGIICPLLLPYSLAAICFATYSMGSLPSLNASAVMLIESANLEVVWS